MTKGSDSRQDYQIQSNLNKTTQINEENEKNRQFI